MALGMAMLLIVGLIAIGKFARRGQLPILDRSGFNAARSAWIDAEPSDYDITIEVTGRQPAIYRAQIRGGETINASRNDTPLTQKRTLRTWSVPGMFDTIESDVESVELFASGKGDAWTPNLTLRAEFDPEWHFPSRYRRIEWGSSYEVLWQVKEFKLTNAPTAVNTP